jgi:GntR family transcriptional regulator
METAANRNNVEALAGIGLTSSPLYREVKLRLTRGLAAGEWKPGEAIPSESRLAERVDRDDS